MIILTLDAQECAGIVQANRVANLACALEGRPYVVPIYYAFDDNSLFSFSLPGRKIEWMRANPRVCLQVGERSQQGWKSVVIDGRFEELPERTGHKREREHARQLLSAHTDWWEPGSVRPVTPLRTGRSTYIFYRVIVEEMSGREAVEERPA